MKANTTAHIDSVLLYDVVALTCIGFLMIWSAGSVYSIQNYHDSLYLVKKQVMWMALSVAAAFWFFKMDRARLEKMIWPGLIIAIVLLFAVHIPGLSHKVGGAKRWLQLGPLSFQPFEMVKVFYVLYMASLFSNETFEKTRKVFRGTMVTGIVCLGLILQKDLGGTVIIGLLYFAFMIMGGVSLVFLGGLLGMAVAGVGVLVKAEPYRMARMLSFMDPWKDPLGVGYQVVQSLIAVGSGGPLGVGFSNSQQKFLYLPALHTDYIFAIIGEELGLWGTTLVLALFITLLVRGAFIAINVKDNFLKYMAAGLTFMITVQASMNMAVALGLMPSKGTTLPFISSGGTALLFTSVAVALLLSASKAAYGSGR